MSGRLIPAAAVLAAMSLACSGPPTAPGPAQRAGAALDRAVATVQDELGEATLKARVRVALLEHLQGEGLGISADVSGSVVTLTGRVGKRSSQELAEQVARTVSGVSQVRNRLVVAPVTPATAPLARAVDKAEKEVADALLETRVKAKLLDQMGRPGFAIEVEATDGILSLSGQVADDDRRALAARIAREVSGVREVHDLLRVGNR
ncbi:MAG TPA: BON domain-containing protein [Thermoanaerobaculaceae bacterium]|nr:BON domain-containing protein [Thermoanaerobaculaceae bacterium]